MDKRTNLIKQRLGDRNLSDLKLYIQKIENNLDFSIEEIILFGSVAMLSNNVDSDIDIAFISDDFEESPTTSQIELAKQRYGINYSFQPHAVPTSLMQNKYSTFPDAINAGIRVENLFAE